MAKSAEVHGLLTVQRRGKFYKTKMCKFYKTGACTRGDACVYAHSMCELQQLPDLHKSELCAQFAFSGSCEKGGACRFAHGTEELRRASEKKEHPSAAEGLPCGANNDSPNDCRGVVYQPVLHCLAAPIIVRPVLFMRTGFFDEQGSEAAQAAAESTCKSQSNTQVVSPNLNVGHADAGEAYCKEAYGEEEAARLPQQAKGKGALFWQACDFDDDLESCCEDDINGEPAQNNCKGSQGPWSRQTTAESSSSFLIDAFSRQTSECSEAEMEHHDEVLCVKNTFLEWKPASCTAALRSKSAEGRIEGLSI